MSHPVAIPLQARAGLFLIVAFTAIWSVYLFAQADWEIYLNRIFSSNDPGSGVSTVGTVEQVVREARSKTGRELDLIRVRYSLGSYRTIHTQTYADESVTRSLRAGSVIPIRFWGDGPDTVRVDLPSEASRYAHHARMLEAACVFALFTCVFCTWGLVRLKVQS